MEHKGFAEQEYFVLHLLSVSREPLGAGAIREELAGNDMQLSEATVGRLLRNLDRDGLSRRIGFRGRMLTEQGKERLSALVDERERIVSTDAFLESIKSREKTVLLEILVARRAIEREISRLAAAVRTDEDLARIRSILDMQNKLIDSGKAMASTDPEFHNELARVAGNKVLRSAIDIIRRSGEGASFFEYIRKKVGSSVGTDHEVIYDAIRRKDIEAAGDAMVEHIDNVIRDVCNYWSAHILETASKHHRRQS